MEDKVTGWWHKDRHRGHRNGTESPGINPLIGSGDLRQGCQGHSMEKRQALQQIVLEKNESYKCCQGCGNWDLRALLLEYKIV